MRQIKNTVKDFYSSFDGTKIYYEIQGNIKNKKIMLFLHGLGGNVTAWDPERKYFSELGYTTIAFDLRGHGLSGRPRKKSAYELENFAQDIYIFIKLYKLSDFILVGQCIGGMVAMILVGKLGIQPSSLILIGTGYKLPLYLSLMERPKALSLLYFALNKFPLSIGKPGQPYLLKFRGTRTLNLRRFFSDVFHTTARSYFGICSNIFSFNGQKFLQNISCPTLIIHGTDDIIFPQNTAIELHKLIKNSQFVFIKGANHILVINNPDEINQYIQKFLNTKYSTPNQHPLIPNSLSFPAIRKSV